MWGSVKSLETKTKILAIMFTVLVIGGPMTMAFAAPDESTIAPEAGESAQAARKLIAQKRIFLARWLLTKGEQTTLEGTISHTSQVTVVEVDGKHQRANTRGGCWMAGGQGGNLMASGRGRCHDGCLR
jgi:hypothetical protein